MENLEDFRYYFADEEEIYAFVTATWKPEHCSTTGRKAFSGVDASRPINAESHMANTWRKPKPSLHRRTRSKWKDASGIARLQQAKALAQTAVKFRPSDGPASEASAMLNVVAVSTASA